jgi:hypothetical protein
MKRPVMVANSLAWNHWERIFRVQTKRVDTPRPTMTLPVTAQKGDDAMARRTDPALAMMRKRLMVRRGPQESESSPVGICMRA